MEPSLHHLLCSILNSYYDGELRSALVKQTKLLVPTHMHLDVTGNRIRRECDVSTDRHRVTLLYWERKLQEGVGCVLNRAWITYFKLLGLRGVSCVYYVIAVGMGFASRDHPAFKARLIFFRYSFVVALFDGVYLSRSRE